jgi:hypothetical protein
VSDENAREGFLSRWSRRKRGVREEAPADARPSAEAPVAPAAEPEPEPDLSLLPKIEDLTAESDLKPFFAKGVPLALRQAAIRRMWTLDPVIRDFVGPADYAWDFNAPDGVPGFSLDLPEEAKALAKRLLGVDRKEQEEAERKAAGTAPVPEQGEAPAAAPPPPVPAAAATPPDFLPPTLLPEAAPAPAAEPEAAPPPRRRHGSALPA